MSGNSKSQPADTIEPLVVLFMEELHRRYFCPLWNFVHDHGLKNTTPGFLLKPEKVIVYVGRTHIAVEYVGPETLTEMPDKMAFPVVCYDYSDLDGNLLERIVGFSMDSTTDISFTDLTYIQDWVSPTSKGLEQLIELSWNIQAQNLFLALNCPIPKPQHNRSLRVVNSIFFDADDAGLRTRHIKWLDFFPVIYDDSQSDVDSFRFSLRGVEQFVENDARFKYPLPDEFKYQKLQKLNRFIELWASSSTSETDITAHLAIPDNQFILSMRFGASSVRSELICDWQSQERNSIKPDFFVVQSNGYADIVEFKLPNIPGNPVTGRTNRESFSSWLNAYIAQTRVYSSYFEDYNNRTWFEQTYGFKVYRPKRWIVVGRRYDFHSEVWKEIISDYPGIEILTFDDLVDGVVAQFYM